jgi:hypothetical protein
LTAFPQFRHHGRADGDIWHKMAVHYVKVQDFDPQRLDFGDFRAQIGEIGAQNGWRNLNRPRLW